MMNPEGKATALVVATILSYFVFSGIFFANKSGENRDLTDVIIDYVDSKSEVE